MGMCRQATLTSIEALREANTLSRWAQSVQILLSVRLLRKVFSQFGYVLVLQPSVLALRVLTVMASDYYSLPLSANLPQKFTTGQCWIVNLSSEEEESISKASTSTDPSLLLLQLKKQRDGKLTRQFLLCRPLKILLKYCQFFQYCAKHSRECPLEHKKVSCGGGEECQSKCESRCCIRVRASLLPKTSQ